MLTLWDWSRPTAYLHDEISTDKRKPTVNANGLIYGAPEESTDYIPVLDPVRHIATEVFHPVRDPLTPSSKATAAFAFRLLGRRRIWDSQTSMHNPMFDEQGRVWFTARVRPPENPAFCRKGSSHPSAKAFPIDAREPSSFDVRPEDAQVHADQHVFPDPSPRVRRRRQPHACGRAATRATRSSAGSTARCSRRPATKSARRAGRRSSSTPTATAGATTWVEPDQPVDPAKDKRIAAGFYGVAVSPVDGSVWGSALGFPGTLVRVNPGPNPTETALAEAFEYPLHMNGYGVRGMDIDRNGVVWSSLASGHLASFDRRKCKGPLNGPKATGKHCPEGWTLYPFPGPQFENVKDPGSVESSYYTWVDQFDTLGLGRNVPIATANLNDGFFALVNGQFVTLARAVSDGLLREVVRRPHRRSERRAGKAGACGRRLRRARLSTWKAAKGRSRKW